MIAIRRGAQLLSCNRQLAASRRRLASVTAAKSSKPASASNSSPSSVSTSTPTSTTARKTLTPGPHTHVHEVNKSRFVATAFGGVASPEEALEKIRSHSHKDASHNCFAFVVRRGRSERCSDDGEPVGTAGRPILSAISGEGLEHVAVVVSRWRFGPKLGPGGLSRAYGAAARDCLRGAAVVELEERARVVVVVGMGDVGSARAALSSCDAREIEEDYSGGGGGGGGGNGDDDDGGERRISVAPGTVTLSALVPLSSAEGLATAIANATGGRGSVTILERQREE